MPSRTRVFLATLGLAAVLYGAASLTGRWLGEPPWWTAPWDEVVPPTPMSTRRVSVEMRSGPGYGGPYADEVEIAQWTPTLPRPHRELISAAVTLAGLALLAGAGWMRRQRLLENSGDLRASGRA